MAQTRSTWNPLAPNAGEAARRDAVLEQIRRFVREGRTISAPNPNRRDGPPDFSGFVGPFRYEFEGEDDLLHLAVSRRDEAPFPPEAAQLVAAFLLPEVPPALIWIKPGVRSHHFYLAHDEVLPPD